MAVNRNFPLQQGDLDFLCSVYAAINALYLRARPVGFPDATAGGLALAGQIFVHVVHRINTAKGGDLPGAISEGIDPKDIFWLVNETRGYWNDPSTSHRKEDPLLPMIPLIENVDGFWKPTPKIEEMREHLQAGHVIIAFKRDDGFDHYSVISSIKLDNTIILYDSYGISQLPWVDGSYKLDGKVTITSAFLL
jgi:hypothetical protein